MYFYVFYQIKHLKSCCPELWTELMKCKLSEMPVKKFYNCSWAYRMYSSLFFATSGLINNNPTFL